LIISTDSWPYVLKLILFVIFNGINGFDGTVNFNGVNDKWFEDTTYKA